MSNFHRIGFGGEARRAHLALIQGGAATGTTHTARQAATHAVRAAAPLDTSATATRFSAAATASSAAGTRRSRHEAGVRAVAKQFSTFDDALLPMVLASGVLGEAAASVVDAIKRNPALRAQAERAFQRARG